MQTEDTVTDNDAPENSPTFKLLVELSILKERNEQLIKEAWHYSFICRYADDIMNTPQDKRWTLKAAVDRIYHRAACSSGGHCYLQAD